MNTATDKIKAYLQGNWFRLGIALILVLVALKKDLSFRINLNSPVRMERQQQQPPTPARQQEEGRKTERYTENAQQQATVELPATERFDFSSSGNSRREVRAIDKLEQAGEGAARAYIQRFGKVAANEQRKFGIPASIILGNALLHSLAGTTAPAAGAANNHFALPCTPDWQGPQQTFDGYCCRQYDNAWTSFRDHSFYVTTGAFSHLRSLSNTDYRGWADALEKAGFSQEKGLARQLVKVIDDYGLQELDGQ